MFDISENGLKVRYFIGQNVHFSISVVKVLYLWRLFAMPLKRPSMDIRLAVKDNESILNSVKRKNQERDFMRGGLAC
jgi:hypothetical protein